MGIDVANTRLADLRSTASEFAARAGYDINIAGESMFGLCKKRLESLVSFVDAIGTFEDFRTFVLLCFQYLRLRVAPNTNEYSFCIVDGCPDVCTWSPGKKPTTTRWR